MSYFDLFASGLTNVTRSIYYGMDLATELADVLLDFGDEENLVIGSPEHDFLFGFVQLLVEQHLADVDISDCLIEWYDRQRQPRFLAPLTSRGRDLVRLISERQDVFVAEGRLQGPPGLRVAQESFLHVRLGHSDHARIPLIQAFQRLVVDDAGIEGG